MKSNSSWEVQVPTFYHHSNNQKMHIISPSNAKMTRFDTLVPPLLITEASYGKDRWQQKGMEDGEDNALFYSIRGHESLSSFTSASTEPPSRDASQKSVPRRSSTSSVRDASRKSTSSKSKSRRNGRRMSASKATTVLFDPTRVPTKSCLKQESKSKSKSVSPNSSELSPQRKRGKIYKVYLPGHRGHVKRQRSIRFNDDVCVREVRSSLSLCKNDHQVLWWQEDEQASIKVNLQRLLSRVDRQGVSKTNGRRYCTRGLERFLDTEDWEIDRIAAEDAVLNEQSLQREDGMFDDSRISAVYVQHTQISLQRATSRGREDADIAESVYKAGASKLCRSASSGSLNASIGLSPAPGPSRPLLRKKSKSFSVLPRRSPRDAEPQRQTRRSQSFRQSRPVVLSTA